MGRRKNCAGEVSPSAAAESGGGGKDKLTPQAAAAAFGTALACGYAGLRLHVPAGALLFSIIGTLALKMAGIPAALPRWFKRFAQVLSGTYIGCSIGAEALRNIPLLIVPAIIIVAAYMVNAYIAGHILWKKFHIRSRKLCS